MSIIISLIRYPHLSGNQILKPPDPWKETNIHKLLLSIAPCLLETIVQEVLYIHN